MAQSISLFFGINCVYLAYKVSKTLWGKDVALRVGWIVALFPSLVLYSVLIMREVYICFFILLALSGIIDWLKDYNFKSFIIVCLAFIAATHFHAAMILINTIFNYCNFLNMKKFLIKIINLKLNINTLVILFLSLLVLGFFLNNKISLPKIGYILEAGDIGILMTKMGASTRGVASYPEWLKVTTPGEIIYKIQLEVYIFILTISMGCIKNNSFNWNY